MTKGGCSDSEAVSPRRASGSRYWDSRFERRALTLLPGDGHATADDIVLVTVLGSCIATCLYDPVARLGGMNHFLLPEDARRKGSAASWLESYDHPATRYGSVAMERLVNALLSLGAERSRLQAKVFGASRGIVASDVGARNLSFVREYLATEGIPVFGEETGGGGARKIHFMPASGDVYVKRISSPTEWIAAREGDYAERLRDSDTDGAIFIFPE